MEIRNRLLELARPGVALNGIDFVEINESTPLALRVHFLNKAVVDEPDIAATIDGGDTVPVVKVADIANADWSLDGDGRPLLTLHAQSAGDFSNYRLTINRRPSGGGVLNSTTLDPFFASVIFSFKVFCPSPFDCAPVPPDCPQDDAVPPPIDYLAKDFSSFRRALSDFSALRYPDWRERSEADFGVMFMEALSALADDLSYQQDRVAAEATLDTATERRSIVRHARLVDYSPRPATSARARLVCEVSGAALPAGIEVRANDPAGGVVPFEIGTGLNDSGSYRVDPKWNVIKPYWWDDKERCLHHGATGMWLLGTGLGLFDNQALLIETAAASPADPPLRQIVHVAGVPEESTDPLFGHAVTRISFTATDVLLRDRDLTLTTVRGNVVPATQGSRRSESFAIENPANALPMPLAFARLGANAPDDYRYPLAEEALAWLPNDDPDLPPTPEIRLRQPGVPIVPWNFVPRLIDAAAEENVFALEPASYRRIAELSDQTPQMEYDGDAGETILFGNGVFGARPQPTDVFDVTYRVGLGARGNVASDAITVVDPAWSALLSTVRNPFPAFGGADRETSEQIRRRAPEAFQARQFRAVRADDYQTEAERLDWVQKAGTAFRWTGSWFTVFTAADPKGGAATPGENTAELIELLNRRRLAGYESYVPPPRYVSIDLAVTLCARPEAFSADVARDALERLAPARRDRGGFFLADRFTFGTPLERSQVEAAIQNVPGVAGVLSIQYRRRGFVPDYVELPDEFTLGVDEILRVENDPDHPERGSVAVNVYGGR